MKINPGTSSLLNTQEAIPHSSEPQKINQELKIQDQISLGKKDDAKIWQGLPGNNGPSGCTGEHKPDYSPTPPGNAGTEEAIWQGMPGTQGPAGCTGEPKFEEPVTNDAETITDDGLPHDFNIWMGMPGTPGEENFKH